MATPKYPTPSRTASDGDSKNVSDIFSELCSQFHDFDDRGQYRRYKKQATSEEANNFAVRFGLDKAQIAIDLKEPDLKTLLQAQAEGKDEQVTWMSVNSHFNIPTPSWLTRACQQCMVPRKAEGNRGSHREQVQFFHAIAGDHRKLGRPEAASRTESRQEVSSEKAIPQSGQGGRRRRPKTETAIDVSEGGRPGEGHRQRIRVTEARLRGAGLRGRPR